MGNEFLNVLVYLAPPFVLLGLGGLAVFLWSLRVERIAKQKAETARVAESAADQRRHGRRRKPKRKSGKSEKS